MKVFPRAGNRCAAGMSLERGRSLARSTSAHRQPSRFSRALRPGTGRAPSADSGSVLVITLIIALLLGLSLTSYLLLVRAQSVSIARSQAWHAALLAAEAGAEEALAQLNATPFATNITFTSDWLAETGGRRLNPVRKLASSAPVADNSYAVKIQCSEPPGVAVTIYATGYATVPVVSATFARALEVRTVKAPLFTMAVMTRGEIEMNGRDLTTDSFDSTDPYRSGTNGKYDSAKILGPRDWQGDVGSLLGIRKSGKLEVHGELILGAGATNNGGFGFTASGGISKDLNVELPDMPAPFAPGTGRQPTGGSVGATNYTYVLRRDRDYELGSMNGTIFVTNDAHAVLYVTGNATINNLVLAPRASLKLYVGGGNAAIGAFGSSGTATNFQFYGLRGNTNITLTGAANMAGTIYAPNARITLNPVGIGTMDFQGALVGNSLDSRVNLKLHFDESLKKITGAVPSRGYFVTSWKEVQ